MIILYSTGCPRCTVLEKKLNEKNIKYQIDNDTNKMIEKGFTEIPMLEVNSKYYNFIEAVKWVNEQE